MPDEQKSLHQEAKEIILSCSESYKGMAATSSLEVVCGPCRDKKQAELYAHRYKAMADAYEEAARIICQLQERELLKPRTT
jgi:phospho-2-dehydro-3-deoxyheptonate aldolase